MDYDEYLRILDNVARENGLCLDEMTELEVSLPEMEFGDDMVTGGFENFKGASVEQRNDCLLWADGRGLIPPGEARPECCLHSERGRGLLSAFKIRRAMEKS
jgi:hypothetical protein